jgi:hypothetical protein
MAIDSEIKMRHLEGKIRDEELAAYFESVKTLTKEQLEAELKALKIASNNTKIAQLQAENEKL